MPFFPVSIHSFIGPLEKALGTRIKSKSGTWMVYASKALHKIWRELPVCQSSLYLFICFISLVKRQIRKLYEIYLFIHCFFIQMHFRINRDNAVRRQLIVLMAIGHGPAPNILAVSLRVRRGQDAMMR